MLYKDDCYYMLLSIFSPSEVNKLSKFLEIKPYDYKEYAIKFLIKYIEINKEKFLTDDEKFIFFLGFINQIKDCLFTIDKVKKSFCIFPGKGDEKRNDELFLEFHTGINNILKARCSYGRHLDFDGDEPNIYW
jgi:hypothetical protein